MKLKLKNGIVFLIITASVLFLFKSILLNLNTTYFATGGDGLKAYYGAIYHNKYDRNYHHFNGMNYPYGENIFFTGSQPPISNAIKFIDEHLFDCSDYIVGIMNGMMIASIILGIFFLYLIFRRFNIPAWYSLLVAMGIGFLSPQIGRLGGHFSLSWMLWIPLELYLLQLIQENRSWHRSVLFGITTLLAGMMHLYFFMFSGFFLLFYWGNQLIYKKDKLKEAAPYLHLLIQLIIPFILIQLLMGQYDTVSDRTEFPWGFYSYRSYPGSVLLPINKWYVPFISDLGFTRKYSWEAFSYTGIIATIGFFIIIILNFFRHKSKSFSDNPHTETWFWASIAALLFSMGVPFILGLDILRLMVGPIAQIRALGRFAWLFYYVLNIIVFIKLYRYLQTKETRSNYKIFIFTAIIGILFFEAYSNTRIIKSLNNKIPSFTYAVQASGETTSPINKNNYQAIMPLPFFHVGSESSWIEPKCGMAQKTFTTSLETGLPTNAVMLSRTSISQSYKNIALTMLPWKEYEVLKDYPSEKPLLLMVAACEDQLNENERRLIKHSSLVGTMGETKFYSLEIDSLKTIPCKYNFPEQYQTMTDSIKKLAKDTLASLSYPDNANKTLQVDAPSKHRLIFEEMVKINPQQPVFMRFWVKNYNHDLVARTQLLLIQSKPDHQTIEEKYTDIFRNIRTIDGDWALIEIKLQPQQESQIFKILVKNKDLNGKPLFFKEFTVSQLSF